MPKYRHLLGGLAALALGAQAAHAEYYETRMFGKFNATSKTVMVSTSIPNQCQWALTYGLDEFNSYPMNFKLYWGGSNSDYPTTADSYWKPSIDILHSNIVGYKIFTNYTLGFTDHVYSPSNNKVIDDARIYENANFFYYKGGAGNDGFDCDRTNGTNGVDYQAHIMHELGHALGLMHFTAGDQSPWCMMYNNAGQQREWCTGEVSKLAKAYAAPGTIQDGIIYVPPSSEVE